MQHFTESSVSINLPWCLKELKTYLIMNIIGLQLWLITVTRMKERHLLPSHHEGTVAVSSLFFTHQSPHSHADTHTCYHGYSVIPAAYTDRLWDPCLDSSRPADGFSSRLALIIAYPSATQNSVVGPFWFHTRVRLTAFRSALMNQASQTIAPQLL